MWLWLEFQTTCPRCNFSISGKCLLDIGLDWLKRRLCRRYRTNRNTFLDLDVICANKTVNTSVFTSLFRNYCNGFSIQVILEMHTGALCHVLDHVITKIIVL